MFNQQQQPTAAQQVQAATQQLTQALIQKEDAQARLTEADKAIVALRNVLHGLQLGQQLAAEIAAEQAAQAPAPCEDCQKK